MCVCVRAIIPNEEHLFKCRIIRPYCSKACFLPSSIWMVRLESRRVSAFTKHQKPQTHKPFFRNEAREISANDIMAIRSKACWMWDDHRGHARAMILPHKVEFLVFKKIERRLGVFCAVVVGSRDSTFCSSACKYQPDCQEHKLLLRSQGLIVTREACYPFSWLIN